MGTRRTDDHLTMFMGMVGFVLGVSTLWSSVSISSSSGQVLSTTIDTGPVTGQRPFRALFIKTGSKKPVNVVFMVPWDRSHKYSYEKVIPALEVALRAIDEDPSLLPNHYLHMRYFDSRCSEEDAMNYAINAYIDKLTDVFLGPVCDFAVAPLVRQTLFWNLPVVTVGANAPDFMREKLIRYNMLTRVGPFNFPEMSEFFVSRIISFKWRKFAFAYESEQTLMFQASAVKEMSIRKGLETEHLSLKEYPDRGYVLKKLLGIDKSGE